MSHEFRFLATEFVASAKPQAEIIIIKRSIQGHNNVTRVWLNLDYAITGTVWLSQKKLWHFRPCFWRTLNKIFGLF